KDRTGVLAHENGVRGIVVNSKLLADSVLLADAMKRDPCARSVSDVVVVIVRRRPARHRALLHAKREATLLGSLEHGNEVFFEVDEILIHAVLLIPADKPTDRIHTEQCSRIENTHHEIELLLTNFRIVMQHVVEISDIRKPKTGFRHCRFDTSRTRLVEWF